jgi:hypothetical protein
LLLNQLVYETVSLLDRADRDVAVRCPHAFALRMKLQDFHVHIFQQPSQVLRLFRDDAHIR